jgi:hypothetical protein
MIDLLDRKVRQMHAALAGLSTTDLSTIEVATGSTPTTYYTSINFSGDDIELANVATLLVTNIACIKDHLKAWCQKVGRPSEGDDLINSNRDVAIVHDLWNIDKHAQLHRPPRSGFCPAVRNLHRPMTLSTGPRAGGAADFVFHPRTGTMAVRTRGNGSVSFQLRGEVVDERGFVVGEFATICDNAATQWEAVLLKAGVSIRAR